VNTFVEVAILLCYMTLAIELTLLHVPSVSSFRSIWLANDELVALHSGKYRRLFQLSKAAKLVFFLPPLAVVYAVFLHPLATVLLPQYQPFESVYEPRLTAQIAAIAMAITGRVTSLYSVVSLVRSRKSTQFENLLTNGIFGHSRNPGLVGMYAMFIGFWLAMPSWEFLLGVVWYFLYMNFKVNMEEDYLANKHGREYELYRENSARYIF